MADGKSSAVPGPATVAVVAVVVLPVTFLAFWAMQSYDDAKDAATLLGAVVGPLVGLGAAAFGIKLSADAKAEETKAKDETRKVKTEVAAVADAIEQTRGIEVRGGPPGGIPQEVVDRLRAVSR